MTISEAEADRLLRPESFGMRMYAAVSTVAPGCGGETYPIEALVAEIREFARWERDQVLALVQVFDRVATEIVIESGGSVPAGNVR